MKYSVEFSIVKTLNRGNLFDEFNAMDEWCKENAFGGYQGGTYSLRDRNGIFIFELESDAMAFKLRWL